MSSTDCLHCLTVNFTYAPTAVRAAFEFQAEETRDLLCLAGRAGRPLLLLRTGSSCTLVSTSQNHVRAFRPVLARLKERLAKADGWKTLRVRLASGSDAGRVLLQRAIPARRFAPEIRRFVSDVRAAAEMSATCGSLSGELAALVRMMEHAAERIWEETGLSRPGSSEVELELETLVAERIVEEELVGWQSSYPALRSSRRPVSDADIGPFDGEERHSMVRIRTASVLAKLRTA